MFSTSTRNFNNRLGDGAQVYLGSAELAGAVSVLGKLPTPAEYQALVTPKLAGKEEEIYKYLNFHLLEDGIEV